MQEHGAGGQFHDFYRAFLLRLFHEGLGKPASERDAGLSELLGDVPFLNGGLFDVHDLERDNDDIAIPDEAFERIFNFFDLYRWHLDERPHGDDNEINPDVLGYIFEKYVNQKQMGAYYTKEDITGYISRNTVIPFLFDAAKQQAAVAFEPKGGVWRLLRDDPDRYIYPSVGHGVTWNARDHANPVRLDAPVDLPHEIAVGLDDVSRRGDWNETAPDSIGLPTETFREAVARRTRHAEVRAKLAAGEITEINDLITLNLDIERFALDVVAQSEGPELLRAFWHALNQVSVLDPTCGSGAFLFAALNILEPLYTAALEGMQGFLDDLEHTTRPHSEQALADFRAILAEAATHANQRYYILKQIVLNNLYGVDIMEEATEICKLRLFLKLVAQLDDAQQIEPLPDIDFNIRAGNTLVGFTSLDAVEQAMTLTTDGQHRALFDEERQQLQAIKAQAAFIDEEFRQFREQQTESGGSQSPVTKDDLRAWFQDLAADLDQLMAREYGIDIEDADAYEQWRNSHQPFHWFAEFYGIMSNGGFDVIIGNPPYVQWRKMKAYTIRGYRTAGCPDIYAACVERSMNLVSSDRRLGLILPISFQFSADFENARGVVQDSADRIWVSAFSRRPTALFDGELGIRSTILLTRTAVCAAAQIQSTRLVRWIEHSRPILFQLLEFALVPTELSNAGWARLGNDGIASLFTSLAHLDDTIGSNVSKTRKNAAFELRFKSTALYYISAFLDDPPSYTRSGKPITQSEVAALRFTSKEAATLSRVLAIGKIALMWWAATGDDFHVTGGGATKYTDWAKLSYRKDEGEAS